MPNICCHHILIYPPPLSLLPTSLSCNLFVVFTALQSVLSLMESTVLFSVYSKQYALYVLQCEGCSICFTICILSTSLTSILDLPMSTFVKAKGVYSPLAERNPMYLCGKALGVSWCVGGDCRAKLLNRIAALVTNGTKPNLYIKAIYLVYSSSPIGCVLVEKKAQHRGK